MWRVWARDSEAHREAMTSIDEQRQRDECINMWSCQEKIAALCVNVVIKVNWKIVEFHKVNSPRARLLENSARAW